ncbi:MAG: hexitol phosphatase HxpB [Salinivirgaceae bacterium]|jgi:HAD superfamily hydrolase (TIGR01509 family)|nr:hexitol phosphatase HxpB [Salinivirgaceae bacterium]
MIKAAIFDMDGLLIDSEPFWKKAEIKLFGEVGIHLTEKECGVTEGLRVDETVAYWDRKFPKHIVDKEKMVDNIVQKVGCLMEEEGESMPGVIETIKFFTSRNMPIAIASASSYFLINIVVQKLKIESYFQIIQSAQNLEYGKPHPQVFIEASRKLKVNPDECLVFEDSLLGVLAGKAARMKVVAVPYQHNFSQKGYCIADFKIPSLNHFSLEHFIELNQ